MPKNPLEIRHLPARELRVASNSDGKKVLTGYAAVFNVLSFDFGGWQEMVSPTAFTRSLQDQPDVRCLYEHKSGKLLGRTKSGTLKLEVDSVGLKFTCELPDTTVASDLAVLLGRGDIDGCSFGFITEQDVWTSAGLDMALRTLLDVTLYEVTITSDPAYPDASVSLRSAPREIRSKLESLAGATETCAVEDDLCGCDCGPCMDGDCGNCADPDCELEECCAASAENRSHRQRMEMRVRLAALKRI